MFLFPLQLLICFQDCKYYWRLQIFIDFWLPWILRSSQPFRLFGFIECFYVDDICDASFGDNKYHNTVKHVDDWWTLIFKVSVCTDSRHISCMSNIIWYTAKKLTSHLVYKLTTPGPLGVPRGPGVGTTLVLPPSLTDFGECWGCADVHDLKTSWIPQWIERFAKFQVYRFRNMLF